MDAQRDGSEKAEHLKQLISRYWQIPAPGVDWSTRFDSQHLSNFSSLRVLRFFASVEERFQINLEALDAIKSFEDLRQRVEHP